MTVFIGADHRGFDFKNKIVEYLQSKNIRVEDMGPYGYDAEDDLQDFASKVAQAVQQKSEEARGIVICGSGIGVSIMTNRYKGVTCGLGFDSGQIAHGREHDHINCLAIPADYVDFEKAKEFIDTFLETEEKPDEKYVRRYKKFDSI